jgi:type I restriction enzyme M protein
MVHLLKMGGRAGIVLPDGSLTGEGVKLRVRERLLTECNLHTIIRLPNSVFQPYATVATNLLFFTKGRLRGRCGITNIACPKVKRVTAKRKRFAQKNFSRLKIGGKTARNLTWLESSHRNNQSAQLRSGHQEPTQDGR